MIAVAPHAEGTVVAVRAQPGARRDAVLGERAGSLRVAVTAAPERGKANEAIVVVIAAALGLRRSQVTLLAGETARDKRFLLRGITPGEVRERLAALADRPG